MKWYRKSGHKAKEDVCAPVGMQYLEHIVSACPLPFVAIGGIKEDNIHEIVSRGVKTICLVSEIVASDDICITVGRLCQSLTNEL